MAAPQTERGFVMIACDLFAALSVADWPKREWTVLAEILLQVYGPRKQREAHVDPRLIEHYTGLSSKNVYRALKSLKACGVITEGANGSFRFVKDFESWNYEAIEKATGSPARTRRLTDGDLRFALSANDRYGVVSPIKSSKPVGIQLEGNGIQRDTVSSLKRYPTGYQNGAPTVSNGIPATIGTGASEDLENLEKRELTHTPRAGMCVSVNGGEPEPFESGEGDTREFPNPSGLTGDERRELDEAAALAERLFVMAELGGMLSREPKPIDGMTVAWWAPALRKLATRPRGQRTWSYLLGILRGFLANGGPDPERQAGADLAATDDHEPAETEAQRKARLAEATVRMKAYRAELAAREGRNATG